MRSSRLPGQPKAVSASLLTKMRGTTTAWPVAAEATSSWVADAPPSLANMSHQAPYLGDFGQAVQLARAAQVGAKDAASATTMAMFLAMEARAHAGNGDDEACSRAFAEAERFFEKSDLADDPKWIGYFDAAELAGEGAHCFRDLRGPRMTLEFVTRAVELTDPVYARTLAFVRLVHAARVVQQREPGQAAELSPGRRSIWLGAPGLSGI